MESAILKRYDEVAEYVDRVCEAADENKAAFGFLSAAVYEQMASKGQLWIAVDAEAELEGYLMFGGTMPILKVFQIYSCSRSRGRGVASLLIKELKEFAKRQSYHSISARVAADLPANRFWEKNGFSVYRQVKGGDAKKRTINIRGCSLAENDLFGRLHAEGIEVQLNGPVLNRPTYALDINLLLDVFKARSGYDQVVKILQTGFQGGYTICVTPEFKKELQRQSASFADDPILRLAGAFPEVQGSMDVARVATSLKNLVFPDRKADRKSTVNDESDLMHLAYCISAGISGFVTREKALLRACNTIKEKHGVAILAPDEIVTGGSLEAKTPMSSDFAISLSRVTSDIRTFLDEAIAAGPIKDLLEPMFPFDVEPCVYDARFDGNLFGVYVVETPKKVTGSAISALYIDETFPQCVAAIDHFLEMALRHKVDFTYRLNLYIGKDQGLTEETLRRKGFFKSSDHFVKIIINDFLNPKNWTRFTNDLKMICGIALPPKIPSKKELQNTGIVVTDSHNKLQTLSWFDFETIIGPRFILTTDRECILVPIRETYAHGLIGNTKKQLSFLSSHEPTLLLEKAYFRSPLKAAMFKRGGIVAYYVSGATSIQELVGFARITYSAVVTADEAIVKLDRQGVLSREDLLKIADSFGMIHVFTFDNFIEFDNRVPFASAKDLGLISGANLVAPEKIDIKKFSILIRQAFND